MQAIILSTFTRIDLNRMSTMTFTNARDLNKHVRRYETQYLATSLALATQNEV